MRHHTCDSCCWRASGSVMAERGGLRQMHRGSVSSWLAAHAHMEDMFSEVHVRRVGHALGNAHTAWVTCGWKRPHPSANQKSRPFPCPSAAAVAAQHGSNFPGHQRTRATRTAAAPTTARGRDTHRVGLQGQIATAVRADPKVDRSWGARWPDRRAQRAASTATSPCCQQRCGA